MTSERKHIQWTAAYAHRVATRCADFTGQQGPQDPRIINLGISKAQVDPVGDYRLQATGDRYVRPNARVPQASGLKSSHKKGQESELIIWHWSPRTTHPPRGLDRRL
jgi:hypothetical protein